MRIKVRDAVCLGCDVVKDCASIVVKDCRKNRAIKKRACCKDCAAKLGSTPPALREDERGDKRHTDVASLP